MSTAPTDSLLFCPGCFASNTDDESNCTGGKGGELPEVEVVDPSTLPERAPTRGVVGRGRKLRGQKRYDTAMVALMAGRHVPQAIRTIAELIKSADRDSVRLKASTTMVELACGLGACQEFCVRREVGDMKGTAHGNRSAER